MFLSYALHHEDVMLKRVFEPLQRGFYIDVGPGDPSHYSVTRAFYQSGWHGINIEPIHHWCAMLDENRPRDDNMNVAIGADRGEIMTYQSPNADLFILSERELLKEKVRSGHSFAKRKVCMLPLNDIFQKNLNRDIHFLRLNINGCTKEVLRTLDTGIVKPWIIIISQSVDSLKNREYTDWEPYLLNNGYHFTYSDGVNRFYLSDEHSGFKENFESPPNVLDDFVGYDLWSARKSLDQYKQNYQKLLKLNNTYDQKKHKKAANVEVFLVGAFKKICTKLKKLSVKIFSVFR